MTALPCANKKGTMQKLAQICIERPVFATMLILALTVIGGFSFFGLGVDLLPKIDLPTVIVTVNNPGASPGAGRDRNHEEGSKMPSTRSAASTNCGPIQEKVLHRSSSLSFWRRTAMWQRRKFATRSI